MKALARFLLVVALVAWASPARAHKPSDSYLTIAGHRGPSVDVRWDIAVRDLEVAVTVDANGDGRVTWAELRRAIPQARAYAAAHLGLTAGGRACPVAFAGPEQVVTHSDGAYIVLSPSFQCPAESAALGIDYTLLFELDPQHRGIARLDDGRVLIFDTDRRHLDVALGAAAPPGQLAAAVRSGVHHIWTGYDHLLFLLALLLPAVLRRRDGVWTGGDDVRAAGTDIARVVTAFTVAHSITLSLAAFDVVAPPARLIESLIAASVLVAAANNLYPVLGRDRWLAAFALGLLHGFGFSATLNDAGLTGRALVKTLFGFNVGVELGQMSLVALFIPVAWLLREHRLYRTLVLRAGSGLIALVSLVWLIERTFNIALLARG